MTKTIEPALQAEPALYSQIADAIRGSALEVFSTMLEIDILAGEATVSRMESRECPGVIALLGLTGEWSGSGQLSCGPEFACRIASRMLMAEYETVDGDVLDAFAEIANMVIGNAKNTLEAALGPIGLSTPATVFGEEFRTRIVGNPDRVVLPFSHPEGTLRVEIGLARQQFAPHLYGRHGAGHAALAV